MIVIGCEPEIVQLFLLSLSEVAETMKANPGMKELPDPENDPLEFASAYLAVYESIYSAVMGHRKLSHQVFEKYCGLVALYSYSEFTVQDEVVAQVRYLMQFSDVTFEAKRGIV